ncbi:MAG: nucleoside triphosphate pyrophosphatase [Planctomycetaceae bacterium]
MSDSMVSSSRLETQPGRIVLGSRSPRRYELLSFIVGKDHIIVCPPQDATEAGFDGLRTLAELSGRLTAIARAKNVDVTKQLVDVGSFPAVAAVLTADTVIVARGERGDPVVLGQPPDDDTWRDVVREWFERFLLGWPHAALTAVCVTTPDGRRQEQVVRTDVRFRAAAREWLEWYLDTGEPRGKAGGYALHGAGSLFVESINGSPSNVVGLPLRESAEMLRGLRLV